MLAIGELRRGESAAAVQRMRDAVAVLPRNAELQGNLTDLLFLTGATDAVARVDQGLQRGAGARAGYSGYTLRTMRAALWLKTGNPERAQPLIDAALAENRAAIEAGDRSYPPHYENAALHLMGGNRTAALEELESAYAAGCRDADFLKVDPLLAPLASEPRFLQLLDRINRDLREMRARVDLREFDELAKTGQK
jgi:hypothetical protein